MQHLLAQAARPVGNFGHFAIVFIAGVLISLVAYDVIPVPDRTKRKLVVCKGLGPILIVGGAILMLVSVFVHH